MSTEAAAVAGGDVVKWALWLSGIIYWQVALGVKWSGFVVFVYVVSWKQAQKQESGTDIGTEDNDHHFALKIWKLIFFNKKQMIMQC